MASFPTGCIIFSTDGVPECSWSVPFLLTASSRIEACVHLLLSCIGCRTLSLVRWQQQCFPVGHKPTLGLKSRWMRLLAQFLNAMWGRQWHFNSFLSIMQKYSANFNSLRFATVDVNSSRLNCCLPEPSAYSKVSEPTWRGLFCKPPTNCICVTSSTVIWQCDEVLWQLLKTKVPVPAPLLS